MTTRRSACRSWLPAMTVDRKGLLFFCSAKFASGGCLISCAIAAVAVAPFALLS
jgi:hypothetical protein